MTEIIVTNPATEEICGRYSMMNQDKVDSIINSTHEATTFVVKHAIFNSKKMFAGNGIVVAEK